MAGWCAVYLADTMLRVQQWSGFGVVSMVGSVILLAKTLQQTLAQMTTDNPRIGGQQTLQVVVPGVNLPTNQLAYFFVALLLSGVIHELGHAVAALREQVRVNGFGMFIFVVYPGAFVDLFTTHLNIISPTQQLLAFLFFLPVFLFPMYTTGAGALVTDVVQRSGGLDPVSVSPVPHASDWILCPTASLQPSWAHGRPYKRLDGTVDCCSNNSLTDLCFSYTKPQGRGIRDKEYACMPVRKMVTGTRVCRTDEDCSGPSQLSSVCVTPSLENQTRFIRVTHPPHSHMLFVGYPPHLHHADTLCRSPGLWPWLTRAVLRSGRTVDAKRPVGGHAGYRGDRQAETRADWLLPAAGGSALLAANVALGLWMVTAR
ncbi:hypothetical protein WMY93_029552 [Mugilogobius chulae]|uniref:Membrane-bound transcription factor site-2 protease n=1 Tax=Mugilogobius chulae TaxID=88201 RepID=A0AAW0MXC6_9GOBI